MSKLIHTVGNLVSIPPKESISNHTSTNCIIFVGKMSYDPNIVAVKYFAESIFPLLRKDFPSLEFIIVGANPVDEVKSLATIDGITVTGFVEDITPYFQNATIVVAPMLTGAGIQNKIIQAMAHGCCVATTSIGAEGLVIKNNEIAIFNNNDEWIEGIKDLLSDRQKQCDMGNSAREYIINNLSKEVIAKQFWQFIGSANKSLQ